MLRGLLSTGSIFHTMSPARGTINNGCTSVVLSPESMLTSIKSEIGMRHQIGTEPSYGSQSGALDASFLIAVP